MRVLKLVTVLGVMLAVSSIAGAGSVPLPPNGLMSMDAWGGFSEIFIEAQAVNKLGLPAGVYNNIGIGYDPAANAGAGGFVLYTGALSSTGAPPVAPGTTIALPAGVSIRDVFTGANDTGTRGRLFVGGVWQSIATATSVTYASDPVNTECGTQLTWSLYNAYVQDIVLTPVGGATGLIKTTWVLAAGPEQPHLDVWGDNTPDATLGATVAPPGGTRYQGVPGAGIPPGSVIPELPVRDAGGLLPSLSDGTYYDRYGTGWPELAFAGDPADDDFVWWSFVGNPDSAFQVQEFFFLPGESFVDPVTGHTIYISGPSDVVDPYVGLSLVGQFYAGQSLAPVAKTDPLNPGYGYGNVKLSGNYTLTADYRFGGINTGAYDSDPNTFTFQQGEPGSVGTLTQLQGLLVPEPLTVLGVFLGVGSLGAYIRRSRRS